MSIEILNITSDRKQFALEKKNYNPLGAIHKLRHTLREGGGRRSMTLCDKGGRTDPKFYDNSFQK